MNLQGKVVLITGGNSGIGRATAVLFVKEGAKVVVAGRRTKEGSETIQALKREGGDALFVRADVTMEEDVKSLVARVIEQYGRLELVKNPFTLKTPRGSESMSVIARFRQSRTSVVSFDSAEDAQLPFETFFVGLCAPVGWRFPSGLLCALFGSPVFDCGLVRIVRFSEQERCFTFITGADTFRSMKATNWEFTNRATVFGLIFGLTFPLYALDNQNSTVALANWLGATLHTDADRVARLLFASAAALLFVAALIRTWASSYLQASVVYAADVKSESLVADGPYRRVRNPLYFANVLMIIAMGAMMSRLGFFVAVIAMLVFCYRLILREEAELRASQGQQYDAYCNAVPRLLPSLWPRAASAGRQARWTEGIKAEGWYWGFAAGLIAYAITLKLTLFFAILAGSLVLFWVSSVFLQKESNSQR